MGAALITPEAEAIASEATLALSSIQAVRVTSSEECQALVDQLKEIKAKAKKLEEIRFSMTRPMDEAKKAILDFFRGPSEVLLKCESLGKAEVARWQNEQARIAAEAEAERRRQEAEERKRQAEEQAAAEALLIQAEEAQAAGDYAAAEQLEAQAVRAQAVAAPIATTAPAGFGRPRGASLKKIWKCRIVNEALVPDEYWIVNEKALDAFAKAMGENAKLPGCEFYAESSVAIR